MRPRKPDARVAELVDAVDSKENVFKDIFQYNLRYLTVIELAHRLNQSIRKYTEASFKGLKYCVKFKWIYGRVMELVDMRDSKSLAFGRGGSSPPSATSLFRLLDALQKNPKLHR